MQRFADQLFGHIGAVGIGRVNEIDGDLGQATQGCQRSGLVCRRPQIPGPVIRIAPKPRRLMVMVPIENCPDAAAEIVELSGTDLLPIACLVGWLYSGLKVERARSNASHSAQCAIAMRS